MMPYTDRRSLLGAIAGGALSLSGCSTSGKKRASPTPRLTELTAHNFDTEPHIFHVQIELEGETVYQQQNRIEGGTPEDPNGAIFEGYPMKTKPYVLTTWIDESEASMQSLDFASIDAGCLMARIYYGTYKEPPEDAHLSIYTSTNCSTTQ